MIDWFVVLVPLALLPIVLLLAFVGCALDTAGKAVAGTRLIVLWYQGIPKKASPITKITATFTVSAGAPVQPASDAVILAADEATWPGGIIKPGKLPVDGGALFTPLEGSAVDCTCTVDLVLADGTKFQKTHKAEKRTDEVIEFKLSYAEWPPAPGQPAPLAYDEALFQLQALKP